MNDKTKGNTAVLDREATAQSTKAENEIIEGKIKNAKDNLNNAAKKLKISNTAFINQLESNLTRKILGIAKTATEEELRHYIEEISRESMNELLDLANEEAFQREKESKAEQKKEKKKEKGHNKHALGGGEDEEDDDSEETEGKKAAKPNAAAVQILDEGRKANQAVLDKQTAEAAQKRLSEIRAEMQTGEQGTSNKRMGEIKKEVIEGSAKLNLIKGDPRLEELRKEVRTGTLGPTSTRMAEIKKEVAEGSAGINLVKENPRLAELRKEVQTGELGPTSRRMQAIKQDVAASSAKQRQHSESQKRVVEIRRDVQARSAKKNAPAKNATRGNSAAGIAALIPQRSPFIQVPEEMQKPASERINRGRSVRGNPRSDNYSHGSHDDSGSGQGGKRGAGKTGKTSPDSPRRASNESEREGGLLSMLPPGASLLLNPWMIGCLIAFVLLMIVIIIIIGDEFDQERAELSKNSELVTSATCDPAEARVGQTSKCTLHATYPGTAEDVKIIADIQAGADYASSNPIATVDNGSRTVRWSAKELKLKLDPVDVSVSVTVKVTANNKTIPVIFTTNLVGPDSAGGGGSSYPPTKDNCNGKYQLNNPFNNYGDPKCDFDKQKLGAQLKKEDSAHAYKWDNIVECESGYNPNAYNPNSASGQGAFGLFQMNPSGKGNGKYDAGNVYWSNQITNAIQYNKQIGGGFGYWACQ